MPCRGQGASEQAADDEGYEQREHNREAAGLGLEQKARQQRLIMEKVRQLPKERQAGNPPPPTNNKTPKTPKRQLPSRTRMGDRSVFTAERLQQCSLVAGSLSDEDVHGLLRLQHLYVLSCLKTRLPACALHVICPSAKSSHGKADMWSMCLFRPSRRRRKHGRSSSG